MWHKNVASRFFGLVTKHACDRRTDGWTDDNYDSQDRASIGALRGKKGYKCFGKGTKKSHVIGYRFTRNGI